MLPILEQVLYEVIEGYDFRVCEDREMGNMEGLTDDLKPIIYLKNSTYLALERGENRPRMTAAHEFGHLLMHCQMPTYRAFSTEYDPLYDPERQANVFAAAFLMPEDAFRRCTTVKEAMKAFGVSADAVLVRARNLEHKLTQERAILTVKPVRKLNKKKGTSKRKSP
ncbi:hypothetical protein L284_18870 [Novosphingobium lindaniclasticum LE124]|uniref:IrrE N-terminal-like domain-containing protein n=2 Tax=Novosphingobium TaxID=165696 RepID=T0H081_9SPHN|nr:hypothetical protein L284_18870 [Novosphingobium lindaniclasticum LE124]